MDFLKFQTILLETRHRGCPTIIKPACIFHFFTPRRRLLAPEWGAKSTSFLIISLTLRAHLGDPSSERYFSYCLFHLSLRDLHLSLNLIPHISFIPHDSSKQMSTRTRSYSYQFPFIIFLYIFSGNIKVASAFGAVLCGCLPEVADLFCLNLAIYYK